MPGRSRTEPRKLPRKRRAAVIVDSLVEAATQVLEREGLGAFTTNRIAEVAGVSIGSLYQYFPNKQAIATAVVSRFFAGHLESARLVLEAAHQAPLERAVELLLRGFVAAYLQQAKVHHYVYEMLPGIALRQAIAPVLELYLSEIERFLEARRGEHTVADVKVGAFLCVHACEGVALALASAQVGPEELERHFAEGVRFIMGWLSFASSSP